MKYFICISLLLAVHVEAASDAKPQTNINVAMMEATCKIVGQSSYGSGFLLGTPDPSDAKYTFYTLVTAHHVLEENPADHVTLVLRKVVNRDEQSYERLETRIAIREKGVPLWSKHPQVDLAAIFVALPQGAVVTVVPWSLLLSDEEIRKYDLSPGTELFCLGYPFGVESSATGFPILRSGKIASFPLLPSRSVKTFLFDFTVFPGNSGGLVYLYQVNPMFGGSVHLGSVQGIMGVVTSQKSIVQKVEQLYERRETTTPLVLGEVIQATFIRDLVAKMSLPQRKK